MSRSAAALILVASFLDHFSKSLVIPDSQLAYSELQEDYVGADGNGLNYNRYSNSGEKGDKGYEGRHVQEQAAKGHSNKERHRGAYDENGGDKKSHHHDDGYYSGHNKGEKGANGAEFEEHGSYAKGHKIRGGHNVHKLNEFKKNTEFFDENHDEAHKERYGGYEHIFGNRYGNGIDGGSLKGLLLNGAFGLKDKFGQGLFYDKDVGRIYAGDYFGNYGEQDGYEHDGGSDGLGTSGYYGH